MRILQNDDGCRYRLGHPLPRSVVIFRALQLGDLLCAVPAFRALRHALPGAQLTLIGLPWARSFVDRFRHYLDRFVEFPGYPGLPERLPAVTAIPGYFERMQKERFDLAIQMHGSGRTVNPVTVLLGARRAAGFYVRGEYCPDSDRFLPYPGHETEIVRNLRLLEHLGIPLRGEHLEFPLYQRDHEELRAIDRTADLAAGRYVCVHPGARMPSRRWPAERFAAVADRIARDGLSVVITGSEDETALADEVSGMMKEPHVNLAGRTSLGALAALLKDARLLVSNDTGVSHIAAALETPRVVVVTGSDPCRWQPPHRLLQRTVFYPVECRPCSFIRCPIGHPCAVNVSADLVVAKTREILGREYAYAP